MASRRREFLKLSVAFLAGAGCDASAPSQVDLVWGIHGTKPGWLHKPRTATFDAQNHLYLADLTDRIQVFDRDGNFLRGWRTPDFNVDGPAGSRSTDTIDCSSRIRISIGSSSTPPTAPSSSRSATACKGRRRVGSGIRRTS
jgi:hypothetical protein